MDCCMEIPTKMDSRSTVSRKLKIEPHEDGSEHQNLWPQFSHVGLLSLSFIQALPHILLPHRVCLNMNGPYCLLVLMNQLIM